MYSTDPEISLTALERVKKLYIEHTLRVLLVDDQETFRMRIRNVLHDIGGFQVVAEVESYAKLLAQVERDAIDMVVAALGLGESDEMGIIAKLKSMVAPPHIILIVGSMQDEQLLRAGLAGVDGYLTRDTSIRDLGKALRTFLQGGPAMLPTTSMNMIHLLVERCRDLEMRHVPAKESREVAAATSEVVERPETPVQRLSPQEEKVFLLMRQGYSNKQIAAQIAISPYTVGKHVQNILRKLGAVNRTQAVGVLYSI